MTNKEFIEKGFYNTTTKNSHGNLYRDGSNNIYSYGAHYPLLFTADDNYRLVFINTTGYSNTTSKHINHAWAAVDYKAIAIRMNGARISSGFILADALKLLEAEAQEYRDEMAAKKRKDTQVYANLQSRLERVESSIKTVKEAL